MYYRYATLWRLVISKALSTENWTSLLDVSRMVDIVGLYAAAQGGLYNKWRAMAEDEFWLLDAAV